MHISSSLIALVAVALVVILAFVLWMWRHQRLLARRAWLMREAIRNRDFTFRLPVRGLLFGERALQGTLNEMGATSAGSSHKTRWSRGSGSPACSPMRS